MGESVPRLCYDGVTMGMKRKHNRRRLRDAYELLSRRWRLRRRSQVELDALGVPPTDRIGVRPPLSIFAAACRGRDPVEIAEGNLWELLEYLAMDRDHGGLGLVWHGMSPPAPPPMEGDRAPLVPMGGDTETRNDRSLTGEL